LIPAARQPLIGTPPAQTSPEGEGADSGAVQNLSSTRYFRSANFY